MYFKLTNIKWDSPEYFLCKPSKDEKEYFKKALRLLNEQLKRLNGFQSTWNVRLLVRDMTYADAKNLSVLIKVIFKTNYPNLKVETTVENHLNNQINIIVHNKLEN